MEHSNEGTQLDQELMLHKSGKITSTNVWTIDLINTVHNMVQSHHHLLHDFKTIPAYLDAASRVYGLRVDSLHKRMNQLAIGVRGNIKSDTSVEVHDFDDFNQSMQNTHETLHSKQPKAKKKQYARINIVAKHRLNAPLKQIPAIPSSFAWHTWMIEGNIDSPLRMFLNWFPSSASVFRIPSSKHECFDKNASTPVEFNDNDDYVDALDVTKDWYTLSIKWMTIARNPIRQTLEGYAIQNTPFDDSCMNWDWSAGHNETMLSLDLTNDIERNVMETDDVHTFDVGDTGTMREIEPDAMNEIESDLTTATYGNDVPSIPDPSPTIDLHRALRRTEYSYIDPSKIKHFWAGPSYWKYPKQQSAANQANIDIDEPPTKRRRNKTMKIPFTTCNDKEYDSDDDIFFDLGSNAAKRLRHANRNKWSPTKLQLPTKINFTEDFFTRHDYHPQYKANDEENCSPSDWHTENDADVENDVVDENIAGVDDEGFGIAVSSTPLISFENDQPIPTSTSFQDDVDFIDNFHFDNAPKPVEVIKVPFANRPKIVNVKRLVRYTKQSIDHQLRRGVANYSRVYAQLEKSPLSNILSPGLVLYAILQNANRHRLQLNAQHNENNDVCDVEMRKAN